MYRFQFISQGQTPEEHLKNCKEVLNAGGKWIQLRMKNFPDEIVEKTALEVQSLCAQFGATFILNDNVNLAKKINADGVHLGLSDTAIIEARLILGKDKIIGGTANTVEDVVQRIEEGCNYIGLGPYRFTTTKEKLSPILGLEGYRSLINRLNEEQRKTPIVAIGGIQLEDISPILETGISGIALSGILTNSMHKKEIVERINKILYEPV
ncbi:thiamine-phosphate pyrophosphorylase [Algoriphagus sp. 4150]|uniref:thiamine phosphate synthase n=1 Tax=Algoriphagus sp. 4150 TaxID=2817756 RepID=UPI00285A4B16|nr:thiamine phosphate synthase [Algoriphagus sp. 4150]MDR7128977.1 thiamine-phosphate pyrophosphorylase [Algoriphagus sp. 4150]